jgi:DNA-binding NarL/FixJ family response regulator
VSTAYGLTIPQAPIESVASRRAITGSAVVRETADARLALREATAAATEAVVRARFLASLLDEALAALYEGETAHAPASMPVAASQLDVDLLSPREREVLALVAAGHTNKAIAEALFVSPNTVKTHVASLLYKLRADTRVQLAAIATRRGLPQRAAAGAR